ncbi:MAG: enoyl-CoA hydratase [Myxococcota bacterium]
MGGTVRAARDEQDGRIGWVVFDHPERRNAISVEMWKQIPQALDELGADPDVRVVVMRGAGEVAFVAGADISEFGSKRTGGAAADVYDADSGAAFGAIANFGKPLLAMIHGFCVGGGVAISLGADMRFASSDAVFAVPAARLCLGYAMGGLDALVNLVGPSRAKEIFFTARRFSADEALAMGLVNGVFPSDELEASVRETAARIAENAPLTIRSVKRIVHELARDPDDRDHDAVNASIRECFESDDYKEGVRAFLEKRAPRFQGR